MSHNRSFVGWMCGSQSLSNPGTPHDNVVAEAFCSILKREEQSLNWYNTPEALEKTVGDYIDFYNQKRPHRKLKIQTPTNLNRNSSVLTNSLNENRIQNKTFEWGAIGSVSNGFATPASCPQKKAAYHKLLTTPCCSKIVSKWPSKTTENIFEANVRSGFSVQTENGASLDGEWCPNVIIWKIPLQAVDQFEMVVYRGLYTVWERIYNKTFEGKSHWTCLKSRYHCNPINSKIRNRIF